MLEAYFQWIKRFLIVTCLFMVFLLAFNVIVDPNGVFGIISIKGLNKHKTDVLTDRITKFYYAKRSAPDTLILGTSRAERLDPSDLERYTHGRAFNLSTKASTIYEQYCFFMYMVNHFEIRNLVLGLDIEAFLNKTEQNQRFDEKRFQQGIYLKDYVESLLNFTAVKSSYITVKDNLFQKDIRQEDERGFREWNHPENGFDKRYMERLRWREKRALHHWGGQYAVFDSNSSLQIAKNMKYLRFIVEAARERKIAYKVYVSPNYWKLFDLKYALGKGEFFECWKNQVALITDFYDFTGHNEITEDFRWWWEPAHITTKGGKLILAKLYGDSTIPVPESFGVLITKDTVKNHLASLRKSLKQENLDEIIREFRNSVNSSR